MLLPRKLMRAKRREKRKEISVPFPCHPHLFSPSPTHLGPHYLRKDSKARTPRVTAYQHLPCGMYFTNINIVSPHNSPLEEVLL